MKVSVKIGDKVYEQDINQPEIRLHFWRLGEPIERIMPDLSEEDKTFLSLDPKPLNYTLETKPQPEITYEEFSARINKGKKL